MKFKVLSVLLILLFVVPTFSSCRNDKRTEYSFEFFDTVTTVVAYEKSEKEFSENCERIFALLRKYHKAYDIYKTYEGVENLASVNSAVGEIKAEKEVIELLEFSKELYNKTNGKFNVAFGSVLSLWHYERERADSDPTKAALPSESALKSAAKHTNIEDIIVSGETVKRLDSSLKIDVGGVGKGYAVERVAEFMKNEGMEGYLLNVGGNIRAVGSKKNSEKWEIGVENPDTDSSEPYIEYLSVEDMSVVTSGVYQRFYMVDGKNYHHIIDPESLFPSENYLSVTVVTRDSGVADALSTALFNMSVEEGKEVLKNFPETEVLWVTKGGEKLYTDGFNKFISK